MVTVPPEGLTPWSVRGLERGPPTGATARHSPRASAGDPAAEERPAALAGYLRSHSPAFRLFAAIDGDGAVRATSGWGLFGGQMTVIFVNTHPEWRRRGIGQAMTAAALRAAQGAGARQACLDASDSALPIYHRLEFETVTGMMRFSGPDGPRRRRGQPVYRSGKAYRTPPWSWHVKTATSGPSAAGIICDRAH